MKLEEVLNNLSDAVNRYQNIPLIEVKELSEILREIGCNLAYLTTLRTEYYSKYQSVKFHSKGTSEAAKTKEAEWQVQELDEIRKILRHYGELQRDIRTQISLHKNELN